MSGNPDIVERQVPMERGGGVVVSCKLCGGSWWLDEPVTTHNVGCKYWVDREQLKTRRKRISVKAGGA